MNVLVVADGHYLIDKEAKVYAESVYSYEFYKRYVDVFDKVYAIVRLKEVDTVPRTAKLCSGPNVEFLPLPSYRGPIQYLKKYFKIKKIAKKYFNNVSCAIFRIPAATSNLLCRMFNKTGKPYAVEVVVDPWQFFSKGSIKNISRPFIRIMWTLFVKRACKEANGVSYVTENYLQKRYPASNKAFQSYYSSVEISEKSLKEPRTYYNQEKYIISHAAASFATYGKGHIQLMDVVAMLRRKNINISVKFIGDGPLRKEFEQYAQNLGIEKYVHFVGLKPTGEEVRKEIEKTDLFVFPTKAEGLPRVILEAMASALPCISTPVCGIPEVLDDEFLVPYGDTEKLADTIEMIINNPELMSKASKENVAMASKYTNKVLQIRRKEFYQNLLKCI